MTPHTRQVTAPADSSTPGTSSGGAAGLCDSGTSTAPAARVRQTAGTLIQNTECHGKCCSSTPPRTGPSGRPAATTAVRMPTALGRSASLNAAETTARDSGNTIPAPSPITARAAISSPAETDSAHHTDAPRNTASPASSSRLRPNRSPASPAGSMTPANAREYASTIHCRSLVLACSAAEIDGSAMFKIVRSRATTSTDRLVAPSIHRPARTGASSTLVANILLTNILAKRRNRKAAGSRAA